MALRNERSSVKLKMRQSGLTKCLTAPMVVGENGIREGAEAKTALRVHQAKSNPAPPPKMASKILSVNNCRITRLRLAPRQRRTPISFWRAAARASCRLAMLEQAMSSTIRVGVKTAPNTTHSLPLDWICPISALNGLTITLDLGSISE